MDQSISVLEQYELEIKGIRKGRGSLIISCKEGEFVLKEYSGSEEKASIQKRITERIAQNTDVLVQQIVCSKDGRLCVEEPDSSRYILQTYMDGRECDIKDLKECVSATKAMAKMHKQMYLEQSGEYCYPAAYSLKDEFCKRNNELRRIRRYLKEKKQKNEFERYINKHFNYFFEAALEAEREWEAYEKYAIPENNTLQFCHGDFQHHNVWVNNYREMMILQFEKIMPDLPCRDLYLFMRKLLEKSNWDCNIGKSLLESYEAERPLPFAERISMIYRFAYPEKFWKIANYYFNNKRSFMPEKNMEKFEKVLEQEQQKKFFVNDFLRKL